MNGLIQLCKFQPCAKLDTTFYIGRVLGHKGKDNWYEGGGGELVEGENY